LPRRRKAPKRLEVGCGEPSHPQSPKDLYRRFYFEALDLVISAINSRFDQPGYQTYKNLQELLLQAAHGQDYHKEFEYVVDFYGSDFESSQLDTQLQNLSTYELSLCRNILGLQWNIISFQYYSPKVLGYQFSLQHLMTSMKLPA